MRRYIQIVLCALCVTLTAGEGFGQVVVSLSFPTNARTEALGGVGVGLMGSGSAILYNPAGLAFMEGREASFTYVNWGYGIKNYVAGIAANVPGKGTFGLSVLNFVGYGNDISDYAISGAYGFNLTDRFAVGTTLKLVHEDLLPDLTDNVFVFDLGTYFVTGFRNTVMALSGVFGESTGIRAGLLVDLISMVDLVPFPHYLDLAVDVNKQFYSGSRTNLNLGVEYTYIYQAAGYSVGVSLRGGKKQKFADLDTLRFTWGGGLQFKTEGGWGIEMDYAHSSDRKHILGIALHF